MRSDGGHSAFDYASFLLGLRDYAEKELYDKVCKKGFAPEDAAAAMRKLSDYGYINDARYARHYAELKLKGYGRRKVEYELLKKGVAPNTVAEVLDELADDDNTVSAILSAMRGKLRGRLPADRNEVKKLFDSFARKSYEYELIKKAYNLYTEETEKFESE